MYLQVANHTALFSLFGANFGGDGTTTFGLPDPPAVPNMFWCVAVAAGMWPQRP